MDWKKTIGSVAPSLATMLGGPLAGGVVAVLAEKVLGESTGDAVHDEARLAGMLAGGITPDLRAKILEAKAALDIELVKADVRKTELAADTEKSYIADAANARQTHSNNEWVMKLAVFVNAASYVCILLVLIGSFFVLSGGMQSSKVDPGIAAMIGSLVGAAVQWLLANAAQANGFAFGSSPSSRAVSENLSKAAADVARK